MNEHWTDARMLGLLDVDAFWVNVDIKGPDDCWAWRGKALAKDGYGRHYDAVYWKIGMHPARPRKDGSRHRYPVKRKRPIPAHRCAYVLTYGVPANFAELCVCHSCDNPGCCNPKHMWLGSSGDNMRDRTRKGRTAKGDNNGSRSHPECLRRGENHPHAKLTWDAVRTIRERASNGENAYQLAEAFNITSTHAYRVIKQECWPERGIA